MKTSVRLSDLAASIHKRYLEPIEVENETAQRPSADQIRDLALSKIKETRTQASPGSNTKREIPMKKKLSLKLVAAVAAVCLLSIGVFAAVGGLPYFRSIFGDSAGTVEENIWSPMVVKEGGGYRLSVEGALSDGYKTNLVLSLESLNGKLPNLDSEQLGSLFTAELAGQGGITLICEELPEFSSSKKAFYRVELSSLSSHLGATARITLSGDVADLGLELPIDYSTAAKQITPNHRCDESYTVESIQLSPLGVLVIGSESAPKGGLPSPLIELVKKDGSREELISELSFDGGEETVLGGGGVVLTGPGQQQPLVTRTQGERNPGGKAVITGYFSRVLDLSEVSAISINGTEYPLS